MRIGDRFELDGPGEGDVDAITGVLQGFLQ